MRRTVARPSGGELGRHLFGLATLAFGVLALVWRNDHDWDQLRTLLHVANGPVFVYAVAAAQIAAGAALQFRGTARAGALLAGAVYLALALPYVPHIVAEPRVYNRWGNFIEQFSLAVGAAMAYAGASPALVRIVRIAFGVCAASFAAEQAVYFTPTVDFVPAWIPPSRQFWAMATTVAFALAAVALVTDRLALLAARLTTAMLVGFGLLVWMPILVHDLHNHVDWSETVETFAIAGAAWMLAGLLGRQQGMRRRGR